MTNVIDIPAGEMGVVRLIALPQIMEEVALAALIGAELDPDQVDILHPGDLEEIGLYGYLINGMGIAADQINRAEIEAITGPVAVVRSAAFLGQGARMTIDPPLQLIATYRESRGDMVGGPLHSDAAHRQPGKAAPSNAAMSGRVAMVALLVIFALVAVMIWVAG